MGSSKTTGTSSRLHLSPLAGRKSDMAALDFELNGSTTQFNLPQVRLTSLINELIEFNVATTQNVAGSPEDNDISSIISRTKEGFKIFPNIKFDGLEGIEVQVSKNVLDSRKHSDIIFKYKSKFKKYDFSIKNNTVIINGGPSSLKVKKNNNKDNNVEAIAILTTWQGVRLIASNLMGILESH